MTARNLEMQLKIDIIQNTKILSIDIVDTAGVEEIFQRDGLFAGTYRLKAGDRVQPVVIATSLENPDSVQIRNFSFAAIPDGSLGDKGLSPFNLECASLEIAASDWGMFRQLSNDDKTYISRSNKILTVQQLDDGDEEHVEAQWSSFGFLSLNTRPSLGKPLNRLYFSDPEFSLGSS